MSAKDEQKIIDDSKKIGRRNTFDDALYGYTKLFDNSDQLYSAIKNDTYKLIYALLNLLNYYKLNIVTVESLTAGMIASMLVDVPTFGGNIYGGYIVYDTAAKRDMIFVSTPNVYNKNTAIQMAEGALINSRAMVSIAVTGQAGPPPKEEPEALGKVWMACSIRSSLKSKQNNNSRFYTNTYRLKKNDYFEACNLNDGNKILEKMCTLYRDKVQQENEKKNTIYTI
jgi:PncC family amidohydrolase